MTTFLKGALRGAVVCGVVGLFGPILLWRLLHSSWVDPDSAYAWFRDIGFQAGPEPPTLSVLPALIGTIVGAGLGGLLAVIDTMRDPSAIAAYLDSSDPAPPSTGGRANRR